MRSEQGSVNWKKDLRQRYSKLKSVRRARGANLIINGM